MRCVPISASDDRMDCRHMFVDPINPLPRKCARCGFPDLDHVPPPYYLVKSRTMSPSELALANNGNFFIRERVRRVLDLLAPGQCFDVQKGKKEFPVVHFKHEYQFFEPYAENFAACIRRFAGG